MQPVALDKKDIGKTIIVVIEDGNTGAGVFDDIRLIQIAGDDLGGETSLRGNVAEIDDRRLHAGGERPYRLIGRITGNHLGPYPGEQRRSQREKDSKRETTAKRAH